VSLHDDDTENLLNETVEELRGNGLSPSDVRWVGARNGGYAGSWDDFARCANREYDNGFGGTQAASGGSSSAFPHASRTLCR
jgi:hypothetical protein